MDYQLLIFAPTPLLIERRSKLLTYTCEIHKVEMMVRRLTLLFVLYAILGSIAGGTPLHSGDGQMMACCKKAKSQEQTPQANSTRLCCSLNCSESVPTPPGSSLTFAPTTAEPVVAFLSSLNSVKRSTDAPPARTLGPPLRSRPPAKYLQHSSFLI